MKRILTLVFAVTFVISMLPRSVNSQTNTGINAVLEYCTGTWCQYCPCGEVIIDTTLVYFPHTIVLGYHGPTTSSDPWSAPSASMISLFGFNAYPTAVVNRSTGIIDRGSWFSAVSHQNHFTPPGCDIAIYNYNYNAGTHTITANIISTARSTMTGSFYIMMVLTEDNLIYSQTGNGSCIGSANFVHNFVVKGLINGATGTLLATTDNWSQGNSVTTPLNYTFPAGVFDANCKLNVFVYQQGANITYDNYVQQGTVIPATTGPTGIINQNTTATQFNLSQNYPNPFNPTTNIHFSVPKDGTVSLKVYDMLGNIVDTYVDGFMKTGTYNAEVDASNWASGVYFYTLRTGNFIETKKMSLIK